MIMEQHRLSNTEWSLIAHCTYQNAFVAALVNLYWKQSKINFADECFSYS